MANNVIKNNKCWEPFADAIDGYLAAHLVDVDVTSPLSAVFTGAAEGITMYKVVGNTNTSVYPVAVPRDSHSANGAIVTLIRVVGAGMFIFEYSGNVYICHVYNAVGGTAVGDWYKVTTTAV